MAPKEWARFKPTVEQIELEIEEWDIQAAERGESFQTV
jgi:hypothetical protein